MRPSFLWLAGSVALFGCTEDRTAGGGGFETGDLHAVVTTPAGKPAARAQVWLVRTNGKAGAATVLDSAWTDLSGVARLSMPTDVDRSKLGLDARLGDSLGVTPLAFLRGDSAEVHLGKSGVVEAWVDSTRRIPSIFAPGSHFASVRSDSAPKSVLRLPYGQWEVVVEGVRKADAQRVEIGSNVTTVGGPAWSRKNLDWTDSLELPGAYIESLLFRDPTLAPVATWAPLDSSHLGYPMSAEKTVGAEGGVELKVGATSFSDKTYGGGVGAPSLPASGALVIDWRTASPPESTPDLVRSISIEDSAGGSLRLELDPNRKPSEWISYQGSGGASAAKVDSLTVVQLSSSRWVAAWDQKYVYLWTDGKLRACFYRSGNAAAPHVRIGLGSKATDGKGEAAIDSVRLYQPR